MARSPGPEKRKRQVHPKTRTGCKTCKIRKVKCDEFKPSCKRCTGTGRTCDGYPSTQPIQAIFLAPKTRSVIPFILSQQINTGIPGSATEKRGFQFFVSKTAGELSGYFNEEFWNGFVLRGCHDHGALRHAVIGIGALHEQYELESDGKTEGDNKFAVDQYAKAITHLRHTLDTASGDDSPLTALISCVLFVCFDSLRGSFQSAMLHLQSGLKILKEVKSQMKMKTKRNGRDYTNEEVFIIHTYITPLFVRLIVQAILYVDTRSNAEKTILARDLSVEDSDCDTQQLGLCDDQESEEWVFKNMEEARDKLNNFAGGLFRMFYVSDGGKPMSQQPVMAHNLLAVNSRALSSWSTAFNTYMLAHTSELSTAQIRGAALLKIHHTTLELMRLSVPSMSDPRPLVEACNAASTFTGTVGLFASIVRLSKSLITAIEQDVSKSGGAIGTGKTFSPDLGVVGPLYYVGTKCTVKEIRDEALSLLQRWKGREGMWDSHIGSKLVSEFWKMESRVGTRGYNSTSSEAKTAFQEELKTYRVRLDYVDNKNWRYRYHQEGTVVDGVFKPQYPYPEPLDLEAQDLSTLEYWSTPVLSEEEINMGSYDNGRTSTCPMGTSGYGEDCNENHDVPAPATVDDWMGMDFITQLHGQYEDPNRFLDPNLWPSHDYGITPFRSTNSPIAAWVAR